jgi:hypothetical protein
MVRQRASVFLQSSLSLVALAKRQKPAWRRQSPANNPAAGF